MRLLSVDWDYFVPSIDQEVIGGGSRVPYVTGASEVFAGTLLDALWDARAAALLAADCRLPGTSGDDLTFWNRFRLAAGARLYYADSHAQAAHAAVRTGVTEVWNFDAHHDCGYEGAWDDPLRLGWVACANWMCAYALAGAALRVRYPRWRRDALMREVPPLCRVDRAADDGHAVEPRFDLVFVARSSAWTPPWLDERFEAFITSAPVKPRVCLDASWHSRRLDPVWTAHLHELARAPRLVSATESR
jgi:hypothetical protein